MTSAPLSGTIFLAIANENRRSRIASWLSDQGYSVVEGFEEVPAHADLCLLDPDGANRASDAVRERKRSARPVRVPVLLVASSNYRGDGSAIDEGLVDEVLVAPYDRNEAGHRIRSLLKSRRLSIEATSHQQRYHRLVGALSEGVFLLRRGRVEYVNETGRRLLGGDVDLIGKRFLDLVHPDDRSAVEAAFVGDGPSGTFQSVRIRSSDGGVVPVELKGVGRAAESDDAFPRQVVVRERRSRDYAREMARERIEGTLERISDGFVAIDDAWTITYANERAATLLGYEADALVGTSLRSILPTGNERQFVPHLEHAMSAGDAVTFEDRFPSLNSWFRVNVYPAERGLSVYFRDVTDRKERKRELERYETIVQTASDPIFTVDADGRFATVNDEMVSFTGADRDRLLGAHVSLFISDEDVERTADLLDELATEEPGGRRTIELGVETLDGDSRTCEVSIALLPPKNGGDPGAVGILHDLTDRIRREQRLSVLDRVLRHNLRNKMNVIVGRADAVLTDESSADPLENVREIRRVADDLLTLGEEARRFQEVLDADAEAVERRDLTTIAETVIDGAATDHPEARIETDLPTEAPVRISSVVELAIEEVVENAIVHNDREEPHVDVVGTVGDEWVSIAVADDGPGIPDQEVAVLETGTETALEHGSGLGLWLVYWSVTEYGGEVEFETDDGRGSTVRLRLPKADDSAPLDE